MHLVQEIGSYAGFAAVVGLAVLSALYFSQARDVKRLREWAGRAPERAAEQEARIAAQAQQQRAAAAAAGSQAVAASAVRPQAAAGSGGTPAVRPQPAAGSGGTPAATQAPTLPAARPTPAPSTPILAGVRPPEPWYRRVHSPAPRYIALILGGILVIGAGAAYGVSKLNGSSSSSSSASAPQPPANGSSRGSSPRPAAPLRPGSITVAVLNGTTVTGLAATVADQVEQDGFKRGNTTNALVQGQQAESVVEYSNGNRRAARFVAKKLGISQVEPIDPETQRIAGDATVTVIVGADKANGSG
jgi:hypothetical protein